jgi:hypothetical protein
MQNLNSKCSMFWAIRKWKSYEYEYSDFKYLKKITLLFLCSLEYKHYKFRFYMFAGYIISTFRFQFHDFF